MAELQQAGGQGSASAAVTLPGQTPRAKPYFNASDIEKEILAGLPNQIGRMRDAYDNLRYSMGRFEEYPTRHKDMRYRSPSVRRTSPIFKRVVEVLTMHLYKKQPSRKLRDPEASAWLEAIYRRNFMAPKFKRADQLSCIGGYTGFQFLGSTDPQVPIEIRIWGADQMAYWCDPDDPTQCKAVATLDFWDNQRRLRLYTEDSIREYFTDKGAVHPAFGGTAFETGRTWANPYRDRNGKGLIPFAFSHWEFPTQEFSTNGPGINLRELNQGVNERLDNLGDSIYFNCKPIGLARNVEDGWTPPAELRPGDFITLPADQVDAGGNGPEPTLSYLMPELAYVEADWSDLNAYLDHQLEMWGVPPSLIRMVQSGANSGAALQVEQLPILGWVEGRRGDWLSYEDAIALKAMKVAAAHLRRFRGMEEEVLQLYDTIDAWTFSLRWPPLFVELPGPERDRADGNRMKWGLATLVTIAEERCDLTEDEAVEHLLKMKRQNDLLTALGINPHPEATAFGAAFGVAPGGFGGSPGPQPPPLPQQIPPGYGLPQPSSPSDADQGPRLGPPTPGDTSEESQIGS
jgi:hypothetical protein